MDGEAIERLWAATNPAATSTREMTAGARQDFLEDRWNSQNFRKVVDLGNSLSKKLKVAVDGLETHSKELEEFSSSHDPLIIKEWSQSIEAYHRDPDKYQDPDRVSTQGM